MHITEIKKPKKVRDKSGSLHSLDKYDDHIWFEQSWRKPRSEHRVVEETCKPEIKK